MERFAELLDRLYYTAGTREKGRLLQEYLRTTPDPDRGWTVAAIGGTLSFDLFKRNLVKTLTEERVDPYLFALARDYVGEMSETVAHMWPAPDPQPTEPLPSLTEVVETFRDARAAEIAEYLAGLLDRMTATQRWALLKLGTRGLRIGMSARSLKRVLADYGEVQVAEVERLWHGVEPPYTELLQWLDGAGPKPDVSQKITFHPVMLSHPIDAETLAALHLPDWHAEWKYDGIRVQLVSSSHGRALFSRTGEDISEGFPDLLAAIDFEAVLDGELLVGRDGEIGSFNELQQRLNRRKPSRKLIETLPSMLMVYDALALDGQAVVDLTLAERRRALEDWFGAAARERLQLSELLTFENTAELQALRSRADRSAHDHIEGLMLKNRHGAYVPGRPKGQWFKWKRDPLQVDAVMMYAQRGSGKRSSFYSDYTFGVWSGDQLLPIGKAYSGFTDEELKRLDHWIRNNTTGRFGPVREVERGLVLEVAFDDLHRSPRHKSGIALRFPRISRIRWDKPAAEADTLDRVKALLTPGTSVRGT